MSIIDRLNALREERMNLLAEADTTDSMDRLAEIRERLTTLGSEIDSVEAIRDQMGTNARPVENPGGSASQAPTLGDQLQQVAAAEFQRRGARLPGVMVRQNAASGQNETTAADGGVLLSPTVTTALLGSVRENSFFLPRTRKLAISSDSNSLDMPYWPDKDRSSANRYGGTKAYWMNEADQYTASQTKFATRSMKLSKLGALGYATEEMLRDSRYLESIMMDAFQNAMTWEIDEAILFGAGTIEGSPAKPLGLLNATAATGNKALITVAKESSQTAATVNMQNILKMWNRMDPRSRAKAIWLVNPDIELQLIQMTMQTGSITAGETAASLGVPVYMPANGLASAPYGTLLGRPVVPNEHMAAPGTLGDMAFIDPSEYFWIDRDGIKQTSSVHVRFAYDEMAFKFTYRCNGMPSWYDVGTPAKGTTTRSPYVALAARA